MNDRQFALLNAGKAVHFANWNYENIRSPFARLYLVLNGSAQVLVDHVWLDLNVNRLYLIPPFTLHSDRCSEEFELIYIHFYEQGQAEPGIFERLEMPFEVDSTPLDRLLFDRLLTINPGRELRKYDPDSYDNAQTLQENLAQSARAPFGLLLETEGLLIQLLSRFLNNAVARYSTVDPRILNSLEYIHSHLNDLPSVARLAEQCFLSVDHFIRLFRQEIQLTPQAYINKKRIEKAQSLLIFSTLSVKSIALQLGFGNPSYFNRLFLRETGQTPLEYRLMHSK